MVRTQPRWIIGALSMAMMLMLAMSSAQAGKSQARVGQNPDGSYFIDVPVYFPPGAKRFFPKHRKRLKKVAKFLEAHPDIEKVQVVGHTDGKGPKRIRGKLSGSRARIVKRFLVKLGVDRNRLEIIATEPDASVDKLSPLEHRKLRRVDFVVVQAAQPEPPPAPEPEPVPEPEPKPEPVPEPEPKPVPVPEPEPKPEPVPEPEPKPEPVPEPEPKPEPVLEPEPEPMLSDSPDYFSLDYHMDNPQHLAAAGTGVLFSVAAIMGGMASASASDMEPLYKGTSQWQSAKSTAESRALMANIVYGLAAMGAAGTGWLYYQALMDPSAKEPQTMLSVEPAQGGARFNLQLKF